MSYPISVEDFNQRLKHNIETLRRHLDTNKFCANEYHFIDHTAEDNHFLITRRFFDILAATIIGALPVDQINGVDCYRMTENGLEAVEVKLVELHSRGTFKTERGTVYYGKEPTLDRNRRCNVRSNFRASYEIYNNLDSKNVPTVLVLFDTEDHSVVDAIEMSGEKVIHYLTNIVDSTGAILREKTSKKRTITLSAFINHGVRVNTTVETVGYENWEDNLKMKSMPVV